MPTICSPENSFTFLHSYFIYVSYYVIAVAEIILILIIYIYGSLIPILYCLCWQQLESQLGKPCRQYKHFVCVKLRPAQVVMSTSPPTDNSRKFTLASKSYLKLKKHVAIFPFISHSDLAAILKWHNHINTLTPNIHCKADILFSSNIFTWSCTIQMTMLVFARRTVCPLLSACSVCLRWETETSERNCKTNQKTEIMPVILIELNNSNTCNTDSCI